MNDHDDLPEGFIRKLTEDGYEVHHVIKLEKGDGESFIDPATGHLRTDIMDQLTRDMALFAKGVIESEERTEEEVSGMLNEFADKFADALVELTGTIDSIEKIEAADKLEDTIEESGYADAKTALANLGLIK